ncbi:hypothetical protein BGZ73_001589 [Actinomortierella ambigua]|nr:hypothetical protein BGZ73_001589 [Actinomortierella ambigua]
MELDPPSEAIHAGIVGLIMLVFIVARVFTTRGFAAFKPGFNTRAVATWLAVSSLTLLVIYEAMMAYIQYKQSMGAYFNTPPFESVMRNHRDTTFNATNLNLPARNLTLWDLADNPTWDVWNRKEYMGFFITSKPIGLYSYSDLDLFKALKVLLSFSQSGLIACLLVLNTYWCRHVEALVDEGDFMSVREKYLYYALAIVVYVLPSSLMIGLGYGIGDWRKADLANDISLFILEFLTVIAYVVTVRRLQALNRDARNVDGEDTSVTLQLGYYIYCIYWLLASTILIIVMGILYDIDFLTPEWNPVLAQALNDLMSSLWSTVVILVYPAATFLLYPSVDVLTKPKNDPAPRFKKKDRRTVGDPVKFRESLYLSDGGRDSNSLAQGDSSILGMANTSPPVPTNINANGAGGDDLSRAEAGQHSRTSQDQSSPTGQQPKRLSFYDPRQHQHMESIAAVVSGLQTLQETDVRNSGSTQPKQREEMQAQQQKQSVPTKHQSQPQQQPRQPTQQEDQPASPKPKSKAAKESSMTPAIIMDPEEQEAMSRWLAQYDDVDRAGFISGLEMSAPIRRRRSENAQVAEKPSQQAQEAQALAPSRSRASLERQSSATSATTSKPSTSTAGNAPLVGILKTRTSNVGNTLSPGLERKTSSKRTGSTVAATASGVATTSAVYAAIDTPPPLPKTPPPTTFWGHGRSGSTGNSIPFVPPISAPTITPTDPFYMQQQQQPPLNTTQSIQDSDGQNRTGTPKRRRSNITTRVDAQVVAMAKQVPAPINTSVTPAAHRLLAKSGSFDEHRRQLHPAASGFLNDDPYPSVRTNAQDEQIASVGGASPSSPSSRRSSLERESSSQPPTPTSKKYKAPPPPLPIHAITQNHDAGAPSPGSSLKSTPVTPSGIRPKRSQDTVVDPQILAMAERIYQEQASIGFPSPPPFQRSASSPSTLGTQMTVPPGAGYSSSTQQHETQPIPQDQPQQHQQQPPFRERELSFEEKVAAFVARSKAMNEALAAHKAAAQGQAQAPVAGPSATPAPNQGRSSFSSTRRASGAYSAPSGDGGGMFGGSVAGSAMPASALESELETPTTITTISPALPSHMYPSAPPDSPLSPRYPLSTASGAAHDPFALPPPPSPSSTASPTLTADPSTLPRPLTSAWFENKTSFSSTADVYNHYQNVMRRATESRNQHRATGTRLPSPTAVPPHAGSDVPTQPPSGSSRGPASPSSTASKVGTSAAGTAQASMHPVSLSVVPDSVFDRYQEEARIGPLDNAPSPIQVSPLLSEASPTTIASDRRSSESTVRTLMQPAMTAARATGPMAAERENSQHGRAGGSHDTFNPPVHPNPHGRQSLMTSTDSQSMYSNWTAELSDVTQTSGEVSVGAFVDRRGTRSSATRHNSHPELRQHSSTTSTSTFGGGAGGASGGGHGSHDPSTDSASSRSKRVSDVRKSQASSGSGGTFGSHYGSSSLSCGSGPLMVSNPVSLGRSSSLVDDSKSNMWKSTSVQLSIYDEEDADATSSRAAHDPTEVQERTYSDDRYSDVRQYSHRVSTEEPPTPQATLGQIHQSTHGQDQGVSASEKQRADLVEPFELDGAYFQTSEEIQSGLLPQPSPQLPQSAQQQQRQHPIDTEALRFTSMSNTSDGQSVVRSSPSSLAPSSRPSQDLTHESAERTKSPSIASTMSLDRSYSPRVAPMLPPPPIPARSSSRHPQLQQPLQPSSRVAVTPSRALAASQLQQHFQRQQQPLQQQQQQQQQRTSLDAVEPHSSQLYYDSGDSINTLRASRTSSQQHRHRLLHDDDDARSDPSSAPSPSPIFSVATRTRPYQSTTTELEDLERGTPSPLVSATTQLLVTPSPLSSDTMPAMAGATAAGVMSHDSNGRINPSAQLAQEIFEHTRELTARREEEGQDEEGDGQYGGDDERDDDDDDERTNADEWASKRSKMTSPQSSDVGSEYQWESAEIDRHQWIMFSPASPGAGPSSG